MGLKTLQFYSRQTGADFEQSYQLQHMEIYPLVIKHGNGKSHVNGGFNRKITCFYGGCSSHVWWTRKIYIKTAKKLICPSQVTQTMNSTTNKYLSWAHEILPAGRRMATLEVFQVWRVPHYHWFPELCTWSAYLIYPILPHSNLISSSESYSRPICLYTHVCMYMLYAYAFISMYVLICICLVFTYSICSYLYVSPAFMFKRCFSTKQIEFHFLIFLGFCRSFISGYSASVERS